MTLDDKIKEAERTLKLGAEMSEYYYHKPLIICYSGGKDSDVMLDIAKRCLKPNEFEVLNSHTTVDAPETVYHIREVFQKCEAEGIKTTVRLPTRKGKPTSMWRLIEQRGSPPTRIARYCCEVLKETTTPNRMVAIGVREDESAKRKGRGDFGVREPRKDERQYRSTGHTFAMFRLDKFGGEDAYQCRMIQACKEQKDTICNPIYRFTLRDIWEYVERFEVPMNPLYAKGYKRVGCVGCPLGGEWSMKKEFADYPQYKKNYIKAFDRAIQKRKAEGKKCIYDTGEDLMKWWIGENPNQLTFDDIFPEGGDQ